MASMLSPEVANFPAPSSCEVISQVNRVTSAAVDPFMDRLHLVLPDCLHLPHSISDAITDDADFYTVANMAVYHLFTPEFISNFMLGGQLSLLSCNECDNNIFVSPDGAVTMVVDAATFASLGLDGKKLTSELYVVQIEMNKSLLSQPRRLAQLKNVFEERQVDFGDKLIFSWLPNDADVCPSSLAKYFHDVGGAVEEKSHVMKNKRVSRIPRVNPTETPNGDTFDAIENWLGSVLLGIDYDEEELIPCERTLIVTVDGLMTRQRMESVMAAVSKYVEAEEIVPWAFVAASNTTGPSPSKHSKKAWALERKTETYLCRHNGQLSIRKSRTKT